MRGSVTAFDARASLGRCLLMDRVLEAEVTSPTDGTPSRSGGVADTSCREPSTLGVRHDNWPLTVPGRSQPRLASILWERLFITISHPPGHNQHLLVRDPHSTMTIEWQWVAGLGQTEPNPVTPVFNTLRLGPRQVRLTPPFTQPLNQEYICTYTEPYTCICARTYYLIGLDRNSSYFI